MIFAARVILTLPNLPNVLSRRLSSTHVFQTCVSTTTSLADPVAVNAHITYSASPGVLSTSLLNSTNGSVNGDPMAAAGPGEPLSTSKVERLAQEIAVMNGQASEEGQEFQEHPVPGCHHGAHPPR